MVIPIPMNHNHNYFFHDLDSNRDRCRITDKRLYLQCLAHELSYNSLDQCVSMPTKSSLHL